MESRQDRHRKPKKERFQNKTPLKVMGGLTLAAAACLAIGIGASYWTSNSKTAEKTESASSPIPIDSPQPAKPTSSPSTQPSAKPSPESPANAVIATPTPAASDKPAGSGGQVKLSFVGDVLLASKVEDILKQNGYDYPYTNVKDFLSKPDYTIANLETPITTKGTVQNKDYVYRSSPLALPALKASGIDLVNLANNHVMDYGPEGLLDTMDALDQEGVKRMGAGKDLEEAYKPVIVEKDGVKIAFFGFSRVVPEASWKAGPGHLGVAETYNYKLPVEAIQKAKAEADLVVVVTHWGIERSDQPDKNQTDLAHRYIDAGADLVVGGHPHVLQGFEQYKGKWIAYSLGNFIFTTNDNPKTWETVILEAACSKDTSCSIHLVPILTKSALPTPMSIEDGAKLFQRLSQISHGAQVDTQGNVSKK
ncbi:poly-gamma-glutamate synthesis protein (capsule biosynthesis protein) [Paenibacillus sp. yr247]|uniref:CapA family protein n=1 Tax=Paenibacillus sp. yr247 TaxID=1761880 RepID=UPI00088117E2|nr:CapA family protein [Paenibacillus sp. yr247]SDN17280.1 poly-gamma-glutamate synthesis protein (capsule biosynthesis protein) [Paenibacillus sp. yr247]